MGVRNPDPVHERVHNSGRNRLTPPSTHPLTPALSAATMQGAEFSAVQAVQRPNEPVSPYMVRGCRPTFGHRWRVWWARTRIIIFPTKSRKWGDTPLGADRR